MRKIFEWTLITLIFLSIGLIIWMLVLATNVSTHEFSIRCQPVVKIISLSMDSTGSISFTCIDQNNRVVGYEHVDVGEFNRIIYGEPRRIWFPRNDEQLFDNQ